MRYKIIVFITISIVLLISIAVPKLNVEETKRFHQHLYSNKEVKCVHKNNAQLCTHLPLLIIDTGGTEIPGNEIIDEKTKRLIGYTTAKDGNDVISANMNVIDNDNSMNHQSDNPKVKSKINIRIRGNSSRTFDKKGYAIRLVNDNGENNPLSLMGMDSHHEWVLNGPFLDKTLIRNYMCYNIVGEIMDYSPNVRFCEIILNGKYQGLYLLTEKITSGKDDTRLSLKVNKKSQTYTGYLLRLDRKLNNNLDLLNSFSEYTLRTRNELEIVYPGKTNLTQEMARNIQNDFSKFEKALYSFDYDNLEYGYKSFIDIESFADYFLINEFTLNYDAGAYSTYLYKSLDGKYRMCVWDFNSAFDNYQEAAIPTNEFRLHIGLWYNMLFKDEYFVEEVINRWHKLRKTVLSDEYLNKYIDDTVAFLGNAIDRNFDVWGYTFNKDFNLLTPSDRNIYTYDQAINNMKSFIKKRASFMDENIETLRQYSAKSRVKKYNEASD